MKNIPFLGNGIGFRPELKSFIFLNRDKIDFVEIIAEHYIDVPTEKIKELDLLKNHFTVIPHAINLSIGSAEGIDLVYLQKLKKLINYINPPYWSEHVSYTKAHGIDIGHLSPIVYNDSFLDILQKNATIIKHEISVPFILENITYHVELPGKTYSDSDFLNTMCEQLECGLLLDITNLFINSKNFKFNPIEFLDNLNMENVIQLHYVGFESSEKQIIDTHTSRTQKEIFELMNYIIKKHQPKGIILERDGKYELTDEIAQDLTMAKELLNKK